MKTLLNCAAATLTLISAAEAAPRSSTTYSYYTVNGTNATAIMASLSQRGPSVDGVGAYATTEVQKNVHFEYAKSGPMCRVKSTGLEMSFNIHLPKLQEEGQLSGTTRANWSKFKSFVKTHEETHRSLWLACAKRLQSKIANLTSGDCGSLSRKISSVAQDTWNNCNQQQVSFDAAQRAPLMRHPFVKMMLADR